VRWWWRRQLRRLGVGGTRTAYGAELASPVGVIVRADPGDEAAAAAAVRSAAGRVTGQLDLISAIAATVPGDRVAAVRAAAGFVRSASTAPSSWTVGPDNARAAGTSAPASTPLTSMAELASVVGAPASWRAGITGAGVDGALLTRPPPRSPTGFRSWPVVGCSTTRGRRAATPAAAASDGHPDRGTDRAGGNSSDGPGPVPGRQRHPRPPPRDLLLAEVARRLTGLAEAMPELDTVARIGGDEFAVLVRDLPESSAYDVSTAVQTAVGRARALEAIEVEVEASIGMAVAPGHEVDESRLLRRAADVAMYAAKRGGYSSLSHLKQLPVHEVKIDKRFIMDLASDENDVAIAHAIINLAGSLGLQVVAEGVEDETSWRRLADMGCDFIQGYYLSRPMPAGNVPAWLRRNGPWLGHQHVVRERRLRALQQRGPEF
jgi:GGDEF domain-containing protein